MHNSVALWKKPTLFVSNAGCRDKKYLQHLHYVENATLTGQLLPACINENNDHNKLKYSWEFNDYSKLKYSQ